MVERAPLPVDVLGRPYAAWWRRVVALVIDGVCWAHERWCPGDVHVRFVDVGQGDSAVVELPGGAVAVVDGGGFARSSFDIGAMMALCGNAGETEVVAQLADEAVFVFLEVGQDMLHGCSD